MEEDPIENIKVLNYQIDLVQKCMAILES